MAPSHRARRGSVVAVAALAVAVLPCAAGGLGRGGPATERVTVAHRQHVPARRCPVPPRSRRRRLPPRRRPRRSPTSRRRCEGAEARLEALQRGVADAVAAQEQAAAAAGRRRGVAAAGDREPRDGPLVRANADRSLSATAAQLYMQGGDLQDLTTLVLAPPDVMSDLAMVIDTNAHRVRDDLDAATSAAQDAATQERLLGAARDARDLAATEALGSARRREEGGRRWPARRRPRSGRSRRS